MTTFADDYLDAVIQLLTRLKTEERENISRAANILSETIRSGGRIFAFGCTHSSLPVQDIVYRAGGLMLINPIFGPGVTALDVRPVTLTSAMERIEGYAEALLNNCPIEQGDALIIVSVSGRNALPIEMAMLAKERGIRVIGVTGLAYTQAVESRHSSGSKMYEYCDVILDNKVDKGDAVLSVDAIEMKFCPASGVTSTALLHSLVAATIEDLLAHDFTPPIIIAANVEGGEEHNAALFCKYRDRIFYLE